MGMTPEERDRLAKLEAQVKGFQTSVDHLRESIQGLTTAVDGLREIAIMGKGMWWLTLKVGGLVVGAVALMAAGLTAIEKLGWR